MDIKILVATHKKYDMPSEDIYLPIHVGREGKEDLGYQGDNQGENISLKNSNYCELTGLYWAWKNLQCDVIGLSHYRRYFTDKSKFEVAKNKNNKKAGGLVYGTFATKNKVIIFSYEYTAGRDEEHESEYEYLMSDTKYENYD